MTLTAGTGFQPLCLPEGLPMTSSDIIGSLNEHLLRVLKELRSREQALSETQEALERYRRKFAVIIHQQVDAVNSYRVYRYGCSDNRYCITKFLPIPMSREIFTNTQEKRYDTAMIMILLNCIAESPWVQSLNIITFQYSLHCFSVKCAHAIASTMSTEVIN